MNENLTLKFVECVIAKFSFSRRLLTWIFFDSHTTNSVEKASREFIRASCSRFRSFLHHVIGDVKLDAQEKLFVLTTFSGFTWL